MRAGWLRHWVEVLAKEASRDSFGAEVITWVTAATVWASVEPLRGREYIEAKQGQVEVSHRVVMRWREGIGPEMRLRIAGGPTGVGGRVLEIESVINPLERNERLELMCAERTPPGG